MQNSKNGPDKIMGVFSKLCLLHLALVSVVLFSHHKKCIFFIYCLIFYSQVRLTLGMYFVFLVDWLTVFHREQILVLRLEDYAANLKNSIRTIFNFLSVGVYPTHIERSVAQHEC